MSMNSPHLGEDTRVRTEIHMDESMDNPPVKRIWKIKSESGEEFGAFEISTECVEKWHEFLINHQKKIQELMIYPSRSKASKK